MVGELIKKETLSVDEIKEVIGMKWRKKKIWEKVKEN